jgi:hypothetical protein
MIDEDNSIFAGLPSLLCCGLSYDNTVIKRQHKDFLYIKDFFAKMRQHRYKRFFHFDIKLSVDPRNLLHNKVLQLTIEDSF